jgi:hypothetical protein
VKVAATASNESEALLLCSRLLEAGIQAIPQHTIGNVEFGWSGARRVLVADADLERARELLSRDAEPIDDAELTRLSEQAVPPGEADESS